MQNSIKITKIKLLGSDPSEVSLTLDIAGAVVIAFSYGHKLEVGVNNIGFHLFEKNISTDDYLSKNKFNERKLVHKSGFMYEGFGEIVSIKPLIIDFGSLVAESDKNFNDVGLVGAFVYTEILRIDVYAI